MRYRGLILFISEEETDENHRLIRDLLFEDIPRLLELLCVESFLLRDELSVVKIMAAWAGSLLTTRGASSESEFSGSWALPMKAPK